MAPTAERAAEMLKSLLAPRPQSRPAEAAGEGGDAPSGLSERATPDAAEDTLETPPDLVEDFVEGGHPATVAQAREEPEAELEPIPRRRHGSALPG